MGSSLALLRQPAPDHAKLEKIVKVLMDQVERGIDFQGNAYSLFQTAIVLEDKVRERTRTLETALRELEKTNRALTSAKAADGDRTDAADGGGRKHFGGLRPVRQRRPADPLQHQVPRILAGHRPEWCAAASPFEELSRWTVAQGLVIDVDDQPDEWLRARLHCHRNPADPIVVRLRTGRWLQIRERQTRDGGTVGIYTDITEIKLGEQLPPRAGAGGEIGAAAVDPGQPGAGRLGVRPPRQAGGMERPFRRSPGAARLAGSARRVARRLHAVPLRARRLRP